jgi:hypothetical protein
MIIYLRAGDLLFAYLSLILKNGRLDAFAAFLDGGIR